MSAFSAPGLSAPASSSSSSSAPTALTEPTAAKIINTSGLSAKEAEIYDRQIRLWGIDAQRRMQNSHILISGITGTGAEVAKNLVLAGFNVTLHDTVPVTPLDVQSVGFLFSKAQLGQNRAIAAASAVAELNPMAHVSAVTWDDVCSPSSSSQKEDESDAMSMLSTFAVVLVCNASQEVATRLNAICREKSIVFFATHAFGLNGLFVADCGPSHSYERKIVPTLEAPNVTKVVETLVFPSLASSLTVPWSSLISTRKRGPQLPRVFVQWQVLLAYHTTHACFPSAGVDLTEVATHRCLTQGLSACPMDAAQLKTLAATATADMIHVCAILGGNIAQEVMKAISGQDKPICNVYMYDNETGAGSERLIMTTTSEPVGAP